MSELHWAAGFFDGEGSISLKNWRQNPKWATLQIDVGQDHPEPLQRFVLAVGMGKVLGPYQQKRPSGIKSVWHFYLGSKSEVTVLWNVLGPLLCSPKRNQWLSLYERARELRKGSAECALP